MIGGRVRLKGDGVRGGVSRLITWNSFRWEEEEEEEIFKRKMGVFIVGRPEAGRVIMNECASTGVRCNVYIFCE